MRIICTEPDDYKMALSLAEIAGAAMIQASVVRKQDAYALTIWSIDDVAVINDERVKSMSAAENERFMDYAQKQLKEDMTERGWASLEVLLDLFLTEGKQNDGQCNCN